MKGWKRSLGIVLTVAAMTAATPQGQRLRSWPSSLPRWEADPGPDTPVSHTPSVVLPEESLAPVEAGPRKIAGNNAH